MRYWIRLRVSLERVPYVAGLVEREHMHRSPCVCAIHSSGRGIAPCQGHARRHVQHRRMRAALQAIAHGRTLDPERTAFLALADTTTWYL